jgi:hypothetical protein
MEARSPVVGNKVPIFNPVALVAVLVAVLLVVVVFSQAPNINVLARVATLKARETLNFGIFSFKDTSSRHLTGHSRLNMISTIRIHEQSQIGGVNSGNCHQLPSLVIW